MPKANRINFDHDVVKEIVSEIVNKTPGISNKHKSSVVINDTNTRIDISFVPLKSLYSIYDVAQKVQKVVHFNLTKMFDLYNFVINVTVTDTIK
jgi:uncharacterized alkaline shock family protein YloU